MVVLYALGNVSTGEPVNAYVQDCDVDAHDGQGFATFTRVPAFAKHFADAGEALEYWKRQSTVRPLRADGHPNRPLTAFTVEIKTLLESSDATR